MNPYLPIDKQNIDNIPLEENDDILQGNENW